jgi:nucleotide-binding universal stress UspA family protein
MYREAMTAAPPAGPILLCAGTDGGAAARLAEGAAGLLAERPVVVLAIFDRPAVGGSVEVVMDALYDAQTDLRTAMRRAAADAGGAACEVLDGRGFDVTRRVTPAERPPWRVILDIADELDASVIVAGATDGATAPAGAIGREVRALAHRTHRPLLVLPADTRPPEDDAKALFAYDGSAAADHAIRCAAEQLRPRPAVVACAWRSAAYAVGVAMLAIPDDVARKGAQSLDETARHEAESRARHGAAQLAAAGWSCETATVETARSVPGAIILAAEDHDAGIVVTGTRGRSRFTAALLGSTAEGVLRHAGRPVLLVPPPAAQDAAA